MKPLAENQKGSSKALSFRIEDDYARRIAQTVDDSTYNISSLMRAFIIAGFELLDSNRPSIMPHEIERVWRDLSNVAEERRRRLEFAGYQEKISHANGDGRMQEELLEKIARLEGLVAKLTGAKAPAKKAQKSKSKRKAQ